MTKLDGKTPDLAAENIEQLRQIFPDVFEEGKIDFDKLKQVLGEYVDDEKERYNFTWNGKGKALRLAQTPTTGTLRPCEAESKNWDDTQNLYIEGDNLEVLKLLQKSYHGKIKMIYIDPPYNTGGDFVYPDDFSDSIENYKWITGQVDDEGKKLGTNTEANGRYHTDWLNMMYPRLRLSRNLLASDGVIFISIDDAEQENMRRLCNEVFGEENFMAQIIWQKVYSPRMDVQGFSTSHDYILCYVKSSVESIRRESFAQNTAQFNLIDPNNGKQYRRRSIRKEGSHSTRSERPKLWFALPAPDGTSVYPYKPDGTEGCWRWSLETYLANEQQGIVEWVKTENGWQAYARQYLDTDAVKPPETLWLHQEVGHNHSAVEELKKLLDGKVFDSPKPKELIEKMMRLSTFSQDSDIILDFFSGSATTAHAVMQLNAEDGGNRKFIMVQLPEPCAEGTEAAKAGYKNICEIGKERIRRAGEKIKAEVEEQNAQLKIGEEPKKVPDIGFKVFKLDSSNLKKWNPNVGMVTKEHQETEQLSFDTMEFSAKQLEFDLQGMVENYVDGRSELDVVYEIMLKMGMELTWPLETHTIGGKNVYEIGMGALMICLDDQITTEVAEGMAALYKELAPETWRVVFKDNGFADDSAKVNIKEILKTAGLEEDAFTTV